MPRPTALKLHLCRFADRLALFAEIEEFLRRKTKRGGKQRGREPLRAGVVFLHGIVEEAPRRRDLVLDVAELRLQRLEIRVGLEVGISLGEGKELAQRAREHVLSYRFLLRTLRGDRSVARLDHLVERAPLMRGIA